MTNQTKSTFIGMLMHVRDYLDISAFGESGPGSLSSKTSLLKLSEKVLISTHRLVFSTQGREGLLEIIVPATKYEKKPQEFLEAFLLYLDKSDKLFNEKWQKNILNELSEMVLNTIYELKYLK